MLLNILTWVVSFTIHAGFALFMLLPAGSVTLEEGVGDDIMVVEQGITLEGFAKLGEDLVTIEPIEAVPAQMATAQPVPEELKPPEDTEELPVTEEPEEMKPVEERQVITSESGPDQVDIKEPEEIEEPDPEKPEEPVQKPEPEKVEQVPPPQVAALEQESVAAQRESSGTEKKGGDATVRSAYLGKLRSHLERNKVNPRTNHVGTAIVRFTVNSAGEVVSRRIVSSSGNKVLDEAALAIVAKSAPFPPIPEGVKQNSIEISVPFKFSVR